MSRSKRNRTTFELGHDAFLDIIANLVGVLIILVVVLGTQSSKVIEEIKTQSERELVQVDDPDAPASDPQLEKLASFAMRAASAQSDSDRLEATVKRFDSEIELRERQRAAMLDLLTEAKAAWEAEKSKFDQNATLLAERNREYDAIIKQLAELQGERERIEGQEAPVVAVQHLPTPMAKKAFGDEVYFRLKGNLLSVVPQIALFKAVRDDCVPDLRTSRTGLIKSAVGPIRGYVCRFVMNKEQEMIRINGQAGIRATIEPVRLSIEALEEPIGQPIEEMMLEGSDLHIELAGRDPATTTVVVYVYPDSFADFRKLKEYFYSRGFATDGKPMQMNHGISFAEGMPDTIAQ
ncbi:hypothetical protein Pla52o_03100 [Novipirellula galeiformis]|uniref:Uncharacterized protein n=1 Tax=Novipirellula galeiformis TaxID=2528004 RepID=A0A5C6CSE4_9BACT|nr:hypothetical protein [Novipirellula galeiformis]TWU26457.1 hypothetical protein Pla52o_03100 [Novipirellula galeiformis]